MARYREVRDTLAREISDGVYPVGGRFPTDLELCSRFRVSRNTVREAVRALQDEGVLLRQPGAGSIVRAERPPLYSQKIGSLAELNAYAADARFEKHSENVALLRGEFAEFLGCRPGGKWLWLTGLRRLAGQTRPLAWTEIFLAEPYIDARAQLTSGSEPYYEQLRRMFGIVISAVDQRISATLINPEVAPALDAPAGAPALLTRRRYFGDTEQPFEISLSLHPADLYAYNMRLMREQRFSSPSS